MVIDNKTESIYVASDLDSGWNWGTDWLQKHYIIHKNNRIWLTFLIRRQEDLQDAMNHLYRETYSDYSDVYKTLIFFFGGG